MTESNERRDPAAPAIVFLTGMMASGKSRVGRALARRRGATFIDLDETVETRTGRDIPSLFAADEFRRAESEALRATVERARSSDAPEPWVVATGGGTPTIAANVDLMDAVGVRVFLDAPVEVLVERLGAEAERDTRPLLSGLDDEALRQRLRTLLAERRGGYASARYRVNGSSGADALVDELERVLGWGTGSRLAVHVPARDAGYDVIVGYDELDALGSHVRARVPDAGSAMVVTDENVALHHLPRARRQLERAGLRVVTFVVAAGEASKSVESLSALTDAMLADGLGRADLVLALGGGVVGDLAGLAAATCMRGLPFVQVPTSLLAQVDASVGGKVAVNRPAGKNLFGAFHFPRLVLIDPGVLATLPGRQRASGLAEMLKHGALFDPAHFAEIVASSDRVFDDEGLRGIGRLVSRSVQLKARCVAADPRERTHGGRELLNLGHTVGHALEHLAAGELTHGEAVGLGLLAAGRVSAGLGMADPALEERLVAALVACRLPDDLDTWLRRWPASSLIDAIAVDKKRVGESVRFVALRDVGDSVVIPLEPARIQRLLDRQNLGC